MTSSKKSNNETFDINLDELDVKLSDIVDLDSTINITYYDGETVTDTIDIGDYKLSGGFGPVENTIDINWGLWEGIKPDEVEQMCKHYPGLEKVWRNFKSVYDMCKQDYEGKKKAGEIDDDIPF